MPKERTRAVLGEEANRQVQLPPPRVTPAEKDRITRAAKLVGLSLSAFLRTAALEKAAQLGYRDDA